MNSLSIKDFTQDDKERSKSTTSAVLVNSSTPNSNQPESYEKTVKADDAAVKTSLWDNHLEPYWSSTAPTTWVKALDKLRSVMLLCYRCNITGSLCNYLRSTYGSRWYDILPGALNLQ
eukprot:10199120-Ditylum_brightwellii.AAC.1